MSDPLLRIRPVTSEEGLEAAFAIRQVVFVGGQDCPPEEEFDQYEDQSRHLLGFVQEREQPVATARWRTVAYEERLVAKLERFAVLPDVRGQGLGRQLVAATLADARQAGFYQFKLHAQAHLESFYASFGFASTGRRFEEAGIPHVEMTLDEG